MNRAHWRPLVSCVLILIALLIPARQPAESCGPMFDVAKFTFDTHPDLPLSNYAAGNLGIIKPSFARSYLTVAYRYLQGATIDTAAQKELVRMWRARMEHGAYNVVVDAESAADTAIEYQAEWEKLVYSEIPEYAQIVRNIPKDTSQRARDVAWKYVQKKYKLSYDHYNSDLWAKANVEQDSIMKVRITPEVVEAEKLLSRYDYITWHKDVYPDAWRNAVETYQSLKRRFGAKSKEALDWLYAQDTVFVGEEDNPNAGNSPYGRYRDRRPVLPSLAPSQSSATIIHNRMYQRAAAALYDEQYDESYSLFHQIAVDASSPWHTIAPYLAARALYRKALRTNDTNLNRSTLKQGIDETRAILKDRSYEKYWPAAGRLLTAFRGWYEPDVRIHEVAREIVAPRSGLMFATLVADYTYLLDRVYADDYFERPPAMYQIPTDRPDDLTDWVAIYQVPGDTAKRHAIAKWHKMNSLPWLMAAISKVSPLDHETPSIVHAAEQVGDSSPAYITLRYYLASLAIRSGENDRARRILDSLFASPLASRMSNAVRNDLNALRVTVAPTFEDFVAHIERQPVAVVSEYDEVVTELDSAQKASEKKELDQQLVPIDQVTANILNHMSNTLLSEALQTPGPSAQLRTALAAMLWSRAVITGEDSLAVRSAKILAQLKPAVYGPVLKPFLASPTDRGRTFEAVYALLNVPAFSPWIRSGLNRFEDPRELDHYRDNWWGEAYYRYDGEDTSRRQPTPIPPFVTAEELASANKEVAVLNSHKSGSDYVARRVVEWAQAAPNDPRIPRALHLAIRATRYGSSTDQTGKISKAAYDLLHKRYPKSEWAKKTKYWFD
jgi:hypothetical protein